MMFVKTGMVLLILGWVVLITPFISGKLVTTTIQPDLIQQFFSDYTGVPVTQDMVSLKMEIVSYFNPHQINYLKNNLKKNWIYRIMFLRILQEAMCLQNGQI